MESERMADKWLSSEQFHKLREISPLRTVEGILRAWVPVAIVTYLYFSLMGTTAWYFFLPVAWIVIASRQHALAGLVHESAHRIFFRNREVNDWVGRYLIGFPLFVSLNRYRALHMEHHRSLYTDEDPDLIIFSRYPMFVKAFRKMIRRDLRGATVLKNLAYFVELPRKLVKNNAPARVLQHPSDMNKFWYFHTVLFIGLLMFGHLQDYFVLWLVPYFTLFQGIIRFRTALEHGAIPDRHDPLRNTRTTVSNALYRSLFGPLGLNYHLEHHLYPTIPWYNLSKAHAALVSSSTAQAAHITPGYRAAIREITK